MSARRRLVVEADGGSRGNPGVAGYGALVRDAGTGRVLAERAAPLGVASNNVAEYRGLIAGLQAAQQVDPGAAIEARLDSKLVVEQMSGRWKISHADMRRLAGEAQRLCEQVREAGGSVRFTWVPRARNTAADALSNVAMDGQTVSRGPDPEQDSPDLGEDSRGEESNDNPSADPNDNPDDNPDEDPSGTVEAATTAALAGAARLVLVRHAVTDHTVSGRIDGRGGCDPALNAQGLAQATAVAQAVSRLLGPDPARLVTSSLRRAVQTGAAIADRLQLTAQLDPAWDEQALGDWDGRSMRELWRRHPARLMRARLDPAYRPPGGGESREQVGSRVLPASTRLLEPGSTTVVVTSRVPILLVLADALGLATERFWSLQTAPASLTVVERWPDGYWSVPFVNRTDHLPPPPGEQAVDP